MKITKFGHCCLLVEVNGVRILTDPGMFSVTQNEVTDIDVVLITHEHQDHLHIDSLKAVLQNNPKAKVVTNRGVGKLLEQEGISYVLLEDTQHKTVAGVLLEGFGQKHGVIYEEWGQVVNTGYFIANRFFYPGDALYDPKKPIEILALPVVGPWMKTSEAMEYAKRLKPKVVFPVHDALLAHSKAFIVPYEKFLPPEGISFTVFTDGETKEF
ncbi:MAG: MBL fold metallo-hydrolase [bacterium]|nr:MBL fold metallo-hydrolase [bacterium]